MNENDNIVITDTMNDDIVIEISANQLLFTGINQ